MNWIETALAKGFSAAAIMDTKDLTVVREYRRFCEENRCGCYDNLPACPPKCGTVDEMLERMGRYEKALILQTVVTPENETLISAYARAKSAHNVLADELLAEMSAAGLTDVLVMSAGPWKGYSCMSAYCVDAQKMADCVGMDCWKDDGCCRYFSLILANAF